MKHSFSVSGMTCGHCEKAVTRALLRLDPNAVVAIDRAASQVVVDSAQERAGLASAIAAEGYTVAAESAPTPASAAD